MGPWGDTRLPLPPGEGGPTSYRPNQRGLGSGRARARELSPAVHTRIRALRNTQDSSASVLGLGPPDRAHRQCGTVPIKFRSVRTFCTSSSRA